MYLCHGCLRPIEDVTVRTLDPKLGMYRERPGKTCMACVAQEMEIDNRMRRLAQ